MLLLLCTQARAEPRQLVFSVKTWEGGFASRDISGGVETTPVLGAIYTIHADGSGLRKVVQLGKNTDNPAFSPDGKWIYFQSNASGHSHVYRCLPDAVKSKT
jgi:sugar lactone lactonase YvrE